MLENSIYADTDASRPSWNGPSLAQCSSSQTVDIETYLDGCDVTSASRRGYLSHFSTLYAWCIREGLLPRIRLPTSCPRNSVKASLAHSRPTLAVLRAPRRPGGAQVPGNRRNRGSRR